MSNRNILVIGASRGIGRELVKRFAQDSSNRILACSRNLDAMEREFSNLSNVTSVQLDLASGNVRQKLSTILAEWGRPDVCVCNAGALVNKPFTELTEEDIRYCYEVNVISLFGVLQSVVGAMLPSGGHVVTISSMGGFQGTVKFAGLSAYSTSKAAAASLTELLTEEYKSTPLKFNCLALGAAQTEMLEEAFPGYQAPLTAEEMAEYIADFALNGHRYINGKIIPVSLSTP
jgi:3-oxoacyl-[acyl-carrier protein] reductase